MKEYKILVACGTGIATSTVIADRVKKLCESNGFKVKIQQAKVVEVPNLSKDYDLIVASTQIPSNVKTPYVFAINYLTGINTEAVDKEIIEKLKQIAKHNEGD
ncbi:PTS sugar transporter subunit IIB [Tepidanaerobacter syntrophicus]|uniref:PTS sugar transporter subunit IIB n=1 Tax=Tepidanaerobacter syntrophicus TaxID=224999 RepID=UPI001BD41006|nr:PTS sugar transporter subunit IIB [Tepidanaerobacter syntrophicus]